MFTKAEQNYSVICREMLALIYFLIHFRSYLLEKPFVVGTDHAALTWLQQFQEREGQVARWLAQLQEFSFRIEYRPGKQHSNADALSRKPCSPNYHTNGKCQPTVCIVSQGSESWAPMWSSSELLQK